MSEQETAKPLPEADGLIGLKILRQLMRDGSPLTAMTIMRQHIGPSFRITLPGFRPAVLSGPEPNRAIMVTQRDKLRWRSETDPVTKLLRRGVLVVDGEEHAALRAIMDPPLHRRYVVDHVETFWGYTNQVMADWPDDGDVDMLVEMRKAALLILVGTLFKVDFTPDMPRLWQPILDILRLISPGPWIFWPNVPRRQYKKSVAAMDEFLYGVIQRRRTELAGETAVSGDFLGQLIQSDLDDGRIRDQMLTMLIAGHDTSTALLAWVWALLGQHPEAMAAAKAEVDAIIGDAETPPTLEQIGQLYYLDLVIKETLRLYPPIHAGNRQTTTEPMVIDGFEIPTETRLMHSIYLTHRDERYWSEPEQFCPHRFDRAREEPGEEKRPSLAYIPFGGGPRNCIGAAFAQVESKVVLSRILQRYDLTLLNGDKIYPHMGATLEPHPGVMVRLERRRSGD